MSTNLQGVTILVRLIQNWARTKFDSSCRYPKIAHPYESICSYGTTTPKKALPTSLHEISDSAKNLQITCQDIDLYTEVSRLSLPRSNVQGCPVTSLRTSEVADIQVCGLVVSCMATSWFRLLFYDLVAASVLTVSNCLFPTLVPLEVSMVW